MEPQGREFSVDLPSPGSTFGPYRILGRLGKGGMGQVFEAEQLDNGRRVALKIMNHALASETDTKRFLREGRLAASISHPNVVYVFGSEEIDGVPVIAMELVHEGTLQDLVKGGEPLAVTRAVELALQMIMGLETAEQAGVLHRDIKPANCFLSSEGTVKIGDFGLSISTSTPGESMLTAAGSMLGTPSFASPEQLRGGDLDVRSDIYSVGATLYYLLTGRTPIEGKDLVQTIAAVLDRPPVPPETHRKDLPRNLSKVILRCLEKDPSSRYASYSELAEALRPFKSDTPAPALLGRRALAAFLDDLFSGILPSIVTIATLGRTDIENFHIERDLGSGLILAGFMLGSLLYYALCEGIWGAAPGKFLCRLRVTSVEGGPPGIWKALGRAAIFKAAWSLPAIMGMFWITSEQFRTAYSDDVFLLTDWLGLFGLILLVSMRKRNGFAAIHDLITRTRVVAAPSRERRPALDSPAQPAQPSPISITRIGPYSIDGVLSQEGGNDLLSAHDEILQRQVWIRRSSEQAEPVSTARRELSRPGRLRWLNGRRGDGETWDAFEAPTGVAFLDLAQKPQAWRSVRYWLDDLAGEYCDGHGGETAMPCFSLDRLWITQSGNAILLDFPAPVIGTHPAQDQVSDPDLKEFQSFLHACAATALGHRVDRQAVAFEEAALPLHAQTFLSGLKERTFTSIEVILGNLKSIVGRPASPSPPVRVVSVLLPAVIAGLLAVVAGIGVTAETRRWDRAWEDLYPQEKPLRAILDDFEYQSDILELSPEMDFDPAVEEKMLIQARLRIRQLQIYAGTEFADVIGSEKFWDHPDLGRSLNAGKKGFLGDASRLAADTSEEEVRQVRDTPSAPARIPLLSPWHASLHDGIFIVSYFLVTVAIASLVAIILLGQPLLLRLFGLSVVSQSGGVASRGRLIWRWVLGWGLPVGAVLVLYYRMDPRLDMNLGVTGPLLGPALTKVYILLVILAIYSLQRLCVRPSEGWHDELSRTYVVPR